MSMRLPFDILVGLGHWSLAEELGGLKVHSRFGLIELNGRIIRV